MVTPLFVRDVDAAFISWPCRRNRGHSSCESTYESRPAADSTFRSPSARRCPTSRRSLGVILHLSQGRAKLLVRHLSVCETGLADRLADNRCGFGHAAFER
jgi:hypothetical protein